MGTYTAISILQTDVNKMLYREEKREIMISDLIQLEEDRRNMTKLFRKQYHYLIWL